MPLKRSPSARRFSGAPSSGKFKSASRKAKRRRLSRQRSLQRARAFKTPVYGASGIGAKVRVKQGGHVSLRLQQPTIAVSYLHGFPIPCIRNWTRKVGGIMSHNDIPLPKLQDANDSNWDTVERRTDKVLLLYLEGHAPCETIGRWCDVFYDDIILFTDKRRDVPERVRQIHIEETLHVHRDYLDDMKHEKVLYERIDLSKILMLLYAFNMGYNYCVLMDCFKNHAIRVPSLYYEVAEISGIIYGARLENWAYIAHITAKQDIEHLLDVVKNTTFSKLHSIDDFIYSQGPRIMADNFYTRLPQQQALFKRLIHEQRLEKIE